MGGARQGTGALADVNVAMTLPTMLPHGRDEVVAWCRGVDDGPWSSLAVPERITYTSHSLTVQLAAAAALTERVRLWSTLVVLPADSAVQVAKDMASVDRLSNGRLTVGVGVGGREHDYRAIDACRSITGGSGWTTRWQRCARCGRATLRSTAPTPSVLRRCSRVVRRSSPG